MKDHKSDLVRAIEARKRPVRILEVNMAVAILDKPIHKIAFRVNVKAEENDAIDRAHRYLTSKLSSEEARKDDDVLTDAKLIGALFHACREVKSTFDAMGVEVSCEETAYPVFPSPDWMHEHLTTDQIGVLVNMHNAVRAELSPTRTFNRDLAETILGVVGDLPDENTPGALFAPFSRDGLTQLLIYGARCLMGARGALAEAERAPEGFRVLDVEHAMLILQERATNADDAVARAYADGLRDAVSVLRGERPAASLVPEAEQ